MKRIARIVTVSTLGAAVLGAACAATTAWSQTSAPAQAAPAPATQPQQPPSQQPRDRDARGEFRDMRDRRTGGGDDMRARGGGGGGGGEWSRGEMRADLLDEPSPEEWEEIKAFMKSHSPERLARLEEIGDEGRQAGVKKMFAARYRTMQALKERDPELYQIRLKRMPVEDKAFELSWRLMRKQVNNPEETRKQLRAQLRELVKSRIDERALHLRYMERRLKLEEQRIDETVEANMSDLADERVPRDLRPPQFGGGRRDRRDEDTPNNANASPAEQ